MDSNKELPKDWKTMDMMKTFGPRAKEGYVNLFNGGVGSDGLTSDGGTSDAATSDAATSDAATSEGATGDAATSGAASTDDDIVGEHLDEDDDNEYQDVSMVTTVNVGEGVVPKRVLVFTTVMLLGLLAVCKYGSVDGTFQSSTKKWKQLFVFMVNFNGAFLPIAFGWLPDKSVISYHVFLELLLRKFKQENKAIEELYGREGLKLRKIKLDFDLDIHRAFEPLFKLRGCYFHLSQEAWRQVQSGGVVTAYMADKEFRNFVRSVVPLPFLPLNQLEGAIDELKATEFDKDAVFYMQICKFKESFLAWDTEKSERGMSGSCARSLWILFNMIVGAGEMFRWEIQLRNFSNRREFKHEGKKCIFQMMFLLLLQLCLLSQLHHLSLLPGV